jgi:hypothetical protein
VAFDTVVGCEDADENVLLFIVFAPFLLVFVFWFQPANLI